MHVFGIILGWAIVAGDVLAAMKYLRNRIGRKAGTAFLDVLVRIHGYIGIYLVTIVLLHLLIELVHRGFFVTGLIAGGLLLLQVALGAYGTVVKGRHSGAWLSAHRTVAVLLPMAVAAHVIAAMSQRGA